MATIITKVEQKRGCGYRKKGGKYFISEGTAIVCYKLPIALTVCPCCSVGIKPVRGYTWINSNLFMNAECGKKDECMGERCIANKKNIRMGLLWVGEKYYATPSDFIKESGMQGISRRIANVPNEFEVGKTFIALAHRKAVSVINENGKIDFGAGIFSMFCPSRIEYVVTGNESSDELEKLELRGFVLINVVRDIDAQLKIQL